MANKARSRWHTWQGARWLAIAACFFAAPCLVTPAQADAPTTQPSAAPASVGPTDTSEVDEITAADLRALDSEVYIERHKTTRRLLQNSALTPRTIVEAYRKAGSAEQRHRLRTIARHHFLRSLAESAGRGEGPAETLGGAPGTVPASELPGAGEAGSLGMSLVAVTADQIAALKVPAIRVTTLFPGFPAYAALMPGDLVYGIDGDTMPGDANEQQVIQLFSQMVQTRKAGQSVRLLVLRRGAKIEVPLKLARLAALRAMHEPGQLMLLEPYQSKVEAFIKAMRRSEKISRLEFASPAQ